MLTPLVFDAPGAPAANGHYSHGAVHGGMVFTAVQLPIDPGDPDKPIGSFEEQARQVLRNIEVILEAGGGSLATTLRITVYLTDIGAWPEINRIYSQVLGDHKPARGVVAVSALHLGYQVAMDAIGAVISPPPLDQD